MRPIDGISFHGELPPALSRRQHSRFLATLAHQLKHLAARLSICPAGWKSTRRTSDLSQPATDNAARRLVARSELDLRVLGWAPWQRSRGRAENRAEDGLTSMEASEMVQAN